jgi:ubiquitin C-terminal hydrolase
MLRYPIIRNDQTSIDAYVKILEKHLECPKIKKLHDLYITKLIKSEDKPDEKEDKMETLKGLPNSGNYCFLNSAIQQLFELSAFKNKVLSAKNIPMNQEEYKELFALRQIFEHLKGNINLNASKIQECMVALGYKNKQEDSGEYMVKIMESVKRQLRTLSKKAPKAVSIGNMFDLQVTESSDLIELIKQFCNVKIDLGEFLTLILKEGQFIIKLVRQSKEYEVQNLESRLDLSEISPGFMNIKISKNSEPIKNPKFNLVSITVQTGTVEAGHYVVYRKSGNIFKCIDDSKITDVKWDKLQKILPKNATVLVYKKI